MRGLGILLVVWGIVLPLVAFPLFRNYFPDIGLFGSLQQMCVFIGEIEIPYVGVLQAGALMIGAGATLCLFTNKCKTSRRTP